MAEVAVPVVSVRVEVEGELGEQDPGEPPVGAIYDISQDFFLYDIDLVTEVLLGYGQGAHPVGFEEERQFEARGRQCLVVGGEVGPGVAVHDPASRFDEANVLDLTDMGRSLEHHVLEKVGETGPPFRLGTEPDVVDHGYPDQVVGRVR